MSIRRRNAKVDLLYSEWHRPQSLRRFLGDRRAYALAMVDVDCLECCPWCWEPVALVETKDMRAASKSYTALRKLGERSRLPVFLVEFKRCKGSVWEGQDVQSVRVTAAHLDQPIRLSAANWALYLEALRTSHVCKRARS